MAVKYSRLIETHHPVFLATLISAGLQSRYFNEATGWDYGVSHHKYEAGEHDISEEDLSRLVQVIEGKAEAEPDFWADYISRGRDKGSGLITTAKSLARRAEQDDNSNELLEGFRTFTEATKEVVPFLAATPEVRAVLEARVTDAVADELGGEEAQRRAAEMLPGLIASQKEPDAVGEIRGCYRIALEISKNEDAKAVVLDKMPAGALGRIEDEYPDIHGLLREHVYEYGWLRGQSQGLEPLSERDLVERIQGVLLRWKPAMIQEAAERNSNPSLEELLGFSPSESLEQLIGGLSDLTVLRPFRIDVHLQANAIARPFFAKVAEAVGCSQEQLSFSSVQEIVDVLQDQRDLPISEVDLRIRNSFTVERSQDDMTVHSLEDPPSEGEEGESATITGQTVCRGRAVGTVRFIFGPTEVVNLLAGDVLVSEASTPDKMGTQSAFPGRTDAPLGLEKAAAIVTDEGGLLSHAAIISRELGIPCVVGTERATTTLVDGQVVEVDATKGTGKVIPWGSS